MSAECQRQPATFPRLIGEALLVALIVFGLGFVGMKIAQARHARPIRPDSTGEVHLRIRDSDWHGNTEFVEIDKYDGAWKCTGSWKVQWMSAVEKTGRYEVVVEMAWPAPPVINQAGSHAQPLATKPSVTTPLAPGGQFAVDIGALTLQGTVPDTTAENNWRAVSVGQVDLAAGSHWLTVRPADSDKGASACVRSVTVRPLGRAADSLPAASGGNGT